MRPMANIASLLKSEISRLARKETRVEIDALRKTSSAQRAEIAALKRRLLELEKAVKALGRKGPDAAGGPTRTGDAADEEGSSRLRFSAKGLASNRKRLGLSAVEFGQLIGTTEQSIYAWESGRTQPRAKFMAAIADLRGLGKREVAARLAQLKTSNPS
jgi:DNA-binding XRE family transcriptional regulator